MQAFSIPVYSNLEGGESGGTAFLGSLRGETHLITVAHAFTGRTSSSSDWTTWAPELNAYVIDPSGMVVDFRLDMFSIDSSGNRVPRFKYINSPHWPGKIVDVVALPVPRDWEWVGSYMIADLEEPTAPSVGETISAQGFPVQKDWPEARQTSGIITDAPNDRPGLLLADMPVPFGYSGAPAVGSGGVLLGMVAGHTTDSNEYAQIVPRGFIRRAETHPGGSLLNPTAASF